jgi:hypothetical protein
MSYCQQCALHGADMVDEIYESLADEAKRE